MKNRQSFKNLAIWENCLEMVKSIYILTSVFPEDEKEGVVRAMKKSVIQVPGNIAKGMQSSNAEARQQHLENALNELTEIETLLIVSQKLDFIDENDFESYYEKCQTLNMQIDGLIQKFNK